MQLNRFHWLTLYLIVCLCITFDENVLCAQDQKPGKNITFYAMGDVPYAPEEELLLSEQIKQLPDDGLFVIHLGDIKRGIPPCLDLIYANVSKLLKACKQPVFIIPGDNEWNDCLFPQAAWINWKRNFMRFDQNWQHTIPVFRQLIREENFSFTIDGVLFVGVNLVGGRVHDPEEWKVRHAQNAEWVHQNIERSLDDLHAMVIFGHANPQPVHNDFFDSIVKDARRYGVPVLYLHGDGHTWIKDKPFQVKNIIRVQVDQGGKAPPLKVTITRNPAFPFEFDRRLEEVSTSEE